MAADREVRERPSVSSRCHQSHSSYAIAGKIGDGCHRNRACADWSDNGDRAGGPIVIAAMAYAGQALPAYELAFSPFKAGPPHRVAATTTLRHCTKASPSRRRAKWIPCSRNPSTRWRRSRRKGDLLSEGTNRGPEAIPEEALRSCLRVRRGIHDISTRNRRRPSSRETPPSMLPDRHYQAIFGRCHPG